MGRIVITKKMGGVGFGHGKAWASRLIIKGQRYTDSKAALRT